MNKYAKISRTLRKKRAIERACLSKVPYFTREDAELPGQDVYHCPYCGWWHRTGAVAQLANILNAKRQDKVNQP